MAGALGAALLRPAVAYLHCPRCLGCLLNSALPTAPCGCCLQVGELLRALCQQLGISVWEQTQVGGQ